MNKLYQLLLKSKYTLSHYYCEKAYSFEEANGNWRKYFTVSKYGAKYVVEGHEGIPNFIKTFQNEFNTYKEVVNYLDI